MSRVLVNTSRVLLIPLLLVLKLSMTIYLTAIAYKFHCKSKWVSKYLSKLSLKQKNLSLSFSKIVFMTTTATLWISETPVSIAVEFWKIFGLLVNNKSINYGFSDSLTCRYSNKTVLVRKTFHAIQITLRIQIICNC